MPLCMAQTGRYKQKRNNKKKGPWEIQKDNMDTLIV